MRRETFEPVDAPELRPAGRLRRRIAAITPKGVGLGILIGWALRAVLG